MLRLPDPKKVALESGATLLYQRNPISPTVAFGVWVSRGSRDEKDSERGLSHLLEHMIFRGTARRSALDIALDLEAIGGQWDAFTSKEATCYHGKVLEEHFDSFTDILSDIVLHPSFPADALTMEKRVVQEEIRSVGDSPEEATYELFFRSLFHGDQLGYPVAGRARDVASCDRDKLVAFHRKNYTGPDMILGFIGNIPLKKVVAMVEQRFAFPPGKGRGSRRKKVGSGRKRISSVKLQDSNQSHVCIGARTVPISEPDRYPLIVFSNILGGGISSRLFQELREKEGLAYSVYSQTNFWSDTGALMSYFSVDPRNLPRAIQIFEDCMDSVRSSGVSPGELESSKAQLKASVVFGMESLDSRLFRLFHSEYYHGVYRTMKTLIRDIEKVSRSDISRVIELYLSGKDHTYVTCGRRPLRDIVGSRGRS
ncbi:MAG TPA: pitrilysin family protein [Candidatus Krumholzibacterium sp.]|nr:pitrilysin family protein [Candidatus Krumholzibacterium sp.]